jgi:hypothetical protein
LERLKTQWELDYCQRQAAINRWVREKYRPRLVTVEKILVWHPDEYRRYLRRSPCDGCLACPCCDVPCKAYLHWYDRRMEAMRCGHRQSSGAELTRF